MPMPGQLDLALLLGFACMREDQGTLAVLRYVGEQKRALDSYQRKLLVEAHDEGATFAQIGDALGIARQNAHRHYHEQTSNA